MSTHDTDTPASASANAPVRKINIGISQPTEATSSSYLMSELPINPDTLLFGLNFKYTQVDKKGFLNRFKDKKQSLDLDLSCVLYGEKMEIVDTVWFKQLRDKSAAVCHQGDSLNGRDRGSMAELDSSFDVETIELKISQLPKNIMFIALIVSAYGGYELNSVERGNLYISDDEGNDIHTSDLTQLKDGVSAMCVATLGREINQWRFTVTDTVLDSHNMEDIAQQMRIELSQFYGS